MSSQSTLHHQHSLCHTTNKTDLLSLNIQAAGSLINLSACRTVDGWLRFAVTWLVLRNVRNGMPGVYQLAARSLCRSLALDRTWRIVGQTGKQRSPWEVGADCGQSRLKLVFLARQTESGKQGECCRINGAAQHAAKGGRASGRRELHQLSLLDWTKVMEILSSFRQAKPSMLHKSSMLTSRCSTVQHADWRVLQRPMADTARGECAVFQQRIMCWKWKLSWKMRRKIEGG